MNSHLPRHQLGQLNFYLPGSPSRGGLSRTQKGAGFVGGFHQHFAC